MSKTVFENGDILTPELINALLRPIYKEAPAHDGEIPYPPPEAIAQHSITSDKLAERAVQRRTIEYAAVGHDELDESAWWTRTADSTAPNVQLFTHQTSGGGGNKLVLQKRVLQGVNLAVASISAKELSADALSNYNQQGSLFLLFERLVDDDSSMLVLKEHAINGRNIQLSSIDTGHIVDKAVTSNKLAESIQARLSRVSEFVTLSCDKESDVFVVKDAVGGYWEDSATRLSSVVTIGGFPAHYTIYMTVSNTDAFSFKMRVSVLWSGGLINFDTSPLTMSVGDHNPVNLAGAFPDGVNIPPDSKVFARMIMLEDVSTFCKIHLSAMKIQMN